MVDTLTLFDGIDLPVSENSQTHFVAISVPDYLFFHIAKDAQGLPTLLISIVDDLERKEHLQFILSI
jgi:hypothetical protein